MDDGRLEQNEDGASVDTRVSMEEARSGSIFILPTGIVLNKLKYPFFI